VKLAGNRFYRISSMMMVVSFAQFALVSNSAEASIVESRMMLSKGGTPHAREIDEKKIRRMLENKIVAKKLESYGLSDEKISLKMEGMSDEQVHQLASLSDRIPAGGDAGAAALIVIVTIAVAIILLLVLVVLNRKG
jgi:hypothetical protein